MRDILNYAQVQITQYDADLGSTIVEYKYKNKSYVGYSYCHDEDKDFYSPKVGRYIATARVRIAILQDIVDGLQQELKWKKIFYSEASGYGIKPSKAIDPTDAFMNNLKRADARLKRHRAALKSAKADLRNYIKAQDQFIKSIQTMRAKNEE